QLADIVRQPHRLGGDDAVGQYQPRNRRSGYPRHRAAGEHAVRAVRIHALGAAVDKRLRGVAEGAGAVDDVVDEDAAAALDVADDVHHLGHPGPLTPLIDDREIGVEPPGDLAGAIDAADIGRHDHQILSRVVIL